MPARSAAAIPALFCILVSFARPVPGTPGTTTICTWKDGKKAALSITIDDNCWKDVRFVTSVAHPKGIKITWALITGLIDGPESGFFGTWENWKTVPAMGMGHELASHGVIGGSVLDLKTDGEVRANFRDSKLAIERNVPANGKCISILYHYQYPEDRYFSIMPDYYIAGRGMSNGLTSPSPSRDVLTDGGIWRLYWSDPAAAAIDLAISQGKWHIWFSHAIDDGPGNTPPSVFSGFCDYAYGKRNFVWFGTMRDVARYIYERDAARVQLISATHSRILLNLTHTLDTAVCDFGDPLTLKTEVFDAWKGVTATQGATTLATKTAEESGKKFVYFDALPNSGHILLSDGGPMAVQNSMKTIQPLAFRSGRIVNAARLRRLCGERGWRVFGLNGHAATLEMPPGGTYLVGHPHSMTRILVVP